MNKLVSMLEGPRKTVMNFVQDHWMTQIGWLGHRDGTFYPWPTIPTKGEEPGGYSPVYLEDGE